MSTDRIRIGNIRVTTPVLKSRDINNCRLDVWVTTQVLDAHSHSCNLKVHVPLTSDIDLTNSEVISHAADRLQTVSRLLRESL